MGKLIGNLVLLIFGVTVTVVSATENPSEDFANYDAIHLLDWIGFLLLPLASGFGIRITLTTLSARTTSKITNTIRCTLVVALILGLLLLLSDRAFVIENRNNVFLGMLLAGLALGGLAEPDGKRDVTKTGAD